MKNNCFLSKSEKKRSTMPKEIDSHMKLLVVLWLLLSPNWAYAGSVPCKGMCGPNAPTNILSIGGIYAEVGDGDIPFRTGIADPNFDPLDVYISGLWRNSLLTSSAYRNWTANVTISLQYNGILEAIDMYTWDPALIPDSPELFSSALPPNIQHGLIASIGPMISEFFTVNLYSLANDIPLQVGPYTFETVPPATEQPYGYEWFTNIRPLTVNTAPFIRCGIPIPPSPANPGSYSYAQFSSDIIKLASPPCNVPIPYEMLESWTPFLFAAWVQSHGLGLVNADGTSAFTNPAFIQVVETEMLPALLAAPNMTDQWINSTSPAMLRYLATPPKEWDYLQGWPLGLLTGPIPSAPPQAMAQLTSSKPPAVLQCFTPGLFGPGYGWFKTINARAQPFQQMLAEDWVRFNAQLFEVPENDTSPAIPTPLNLYYQAQKRLPISVKARASTAFQNLINANTNLQIANNVFQKSVPFLFPANTNPAEGKMITLGVVPGFLACIAKLKQPVPWCAAKVSLFINFLSLRPCQGPGDVVYVNQDIGPCSGGTTSFAQWDPERVNITCQVTDQSVMNVAASIPVAPRGLMYNNDTLSLEPGYTGAIVSIVSVIIHVIIFTSAMASFDFYIQSMAKYAKTRRSRYIRWKSLLATSIFLGSGVWIQMELVFATIELTSSTCHVVGSASVRFWSGMMIVQLLMSISIAALAMIFTHFAIRDMAFKHIEQDPKYLQVQGAQSLLSGTETDSSEFEMDADAGDEEELRKNIDAFVDLIKDTSQSNAIFLMSGIVHSANIIFNYMLNSLTAELSSDFSTNSSPILLVVYWIIGSFIMGFIQRSMIMFKLAILRNLVAVIPTVWIVLIQWTILELEVSFEFDPRTNLPTTTTSATIAGFIVGGLSLITFCAFLWVNGKSSLTVLRHKYKTVTQAFRGFGKKARNQMGNMYYRKEVAESNFDLFPRSFAIPMIQASYVASLDEPIDLSNKRDIRLKCVPKTVLLTRDVKVVINPDPLFHENDQDRLATLHQMFEHPLAGPAFHHQEHKTHSLENETFIRDTKRFRLTYSKETAFMNACCIFLYWVRCVKDVDFKNYSSDENQSLLANDIKSKIDPIINIKGLVLKNLCFMLSRKRAPITVFDEADAAIVEVLFPLRSKIITSPANHQIVLPFPETEAAEDVFEPKDARDKKDEKDVSSSSPIITAISIIQTPTRHARNQTEVHPPDEILSRNNRSTSSPLLKPSQMQIQTQTQHPSPVHAAANEIELPGTPTA